MNHYYYRVMIACLFHHGIATKKWSSDEVEIGEDEMGVYFHYHYPGYDNCFWYPDFDAIFDRWEQQIKEIPGVKFRIVKNGFGRKDGGLITLMEKDGRFFLLHDIQVISGSDKPGPHGVSTYRFSKSQNEKDELVKTERSLKVMLNKLQIDEL